VTVSSRTSTGRFLVFWAFLAATGLLATGAAAAQEDRKQAAARVKREAIELRFEQDRQQPQNVQRMALTPCVGGLAGTYPCQNIDLMTFMPLASIGGGNGNDIWGWTDPLDGKEYAIMGRTSGTSFVDVTDPLNPIYLGNLPPHGANSSWRDVKVYANHAYIVSEAAGHGMQIFDLTQLRSVVAPPVTFVETAHYDDFGSSHNLVINEDTGYAYSVGTGTCSAGPHFIDLADPAAPVYAGCHIENLYTHDAQCVIYDGADPDYIGREICLNSNENSINIIDVNDKSAPFLISQLAYSGSGYVHQGWMTEDHLYYMQGDELDEQNFGHNTRTRIVDLTDLDNPTLIANFDAATTSIDHNLYTHDGYVYMANYRSGLRILDVDDIANGNLTEVGYFDIYPSSDSASFNGAWSVYPYFESGNVIVSGIEQGLFILRPNLPPDFAVNASPKVLTICDPGQQMTTIEVDDRNGYSGTVNLSTAGLPAGISEGFSSSSVAAPGTSELTLTSAGASAGSYTITVHATDGILSEDRDLTLNVVDGLPQVPLQTAPADAAIGVSRNPVFDWDAAAQAASYTVDVSLDPGFGQLVFSQTTLGTTAQATNLLPLTTYYWRVVAHNTCGSGSYSTTFSFHTLDIPPILLVDDDDNGPDVLGDYTSALDQLGENYDIWNTANSDAEPGVTTLDQYPVVIWFTGDEFGGAAGPGGGGESALAGWLDGSGCLLLSSQDYYYDRGLTGFMQSHLGLDSATSDVSQSSANGQGSVFSGKGPYTLAFPYTNYTDTLVPDVTAESAFLGSSGDAAIDKGGSLYRSTFWSFGLETLPTATDRESVMQTFLDWCDALAVLDGDSDGVDNATDCAGGDVTTWAKPGNAADLTVTTGGAISWSAPTELGGSATVYDVLRSTNPADFMSATCVESGDTDNVASDGLNPGSGGYYYLIRVRNSCGSALGDGMLPRAANVCP